MKIKRVEHHRVRIKASDLKALDDTTTISPPTDDSFVMYSSGDANYGSDDTLYLDDRDGYTRRIFIRFDLSSLPSGATITLAKVRLYYYSYYYSDPAGKQTDVHRVLESWSEDTITWNNQPSCASTPTSSTDMPSSYGWVEWTVTDDVQGMVDGTYDNYGWRIKLHTENLSSGYSIILFHSKEYDGYDPELYVEYTTATYINVSDMGTGTDYVETQAHLTIGDSGSGVEASALRASIPVSDSGIGSETVLSPQMIEVMDSGSGVDNVPAIILGAISDSGSGVEAIGLEASLKIDDSGVSSEYVEAAPPTTYVTDSGIGVDKVMVVKEQKRIKTVKRVRPAKRVRETKRVEEARG